jgi:hypothetical protein
MKFRFRDLFQRQKNAGQVHAQTKPELGADHEHDFFEMPCDMGRKVYRSCRTKGCDVSETVAATAAQRAETAPLADGVRAFQDQVLGDVERELNKRPRR